MLAILNTQLALNALTTMNSVESYILICDAEIRSPPQDVIGLLRGCDVISLEMNGFEP